jgi:acetyl-CoA synthetase
MQFGDEPLKATSRQSLRLLGTVGEPINPEAWHWYHDKVGHGKCSIVDTWWQTETGGIMITALNGVHGQKPGSATKPFFGVELTLVDDDGHEITETVASGNLCIKQSWPGQMRTVYKNHNRFESAYFSQFHGLYFTGDGARRDADGDYWITGRVDDVLNISGHRLGTAELETAASIFEGISETAVVGFSHPIKGQGMFVYIVTKEGVSTEKAFQEIRRHMRLRIGPIASPDEMLSVEGLPKTRSGKVMRRILRAIANNTHDKIGDTSTLADPDIVQKIIDAYKEKILKKA